MCFSHLNTKNKKQLILHFFYEWYRINIYLFSAILFLLSMIRSTITSDGNLLTTTPIGTLSDVSGHLGVISKLEAICTQSQLASRIYYALC